MSPSIGSRLRDLRRRARRRWIAEVHQLPWVRRSKKQAALRSLASARQILFLCYGNICRSPFAERVARRLLPESVTTLSAGVYPETGRSSPAEAQRAAQELGFELDDHRSGLVTPTMLREADLILVFDASNYRDVLEHDRNLLRRTHFLGNLDLSGPLQIADPWGKSDEAFLQTYLRIHGILEGSLSKRSGAGEGIR
jgi:protein-tyrosine phosphatase